MHRKPAIQKAVCLSESLTLLIITLVYSANASAFISHLIVFIYSETYSRWHGVDRMRRRQITACTAEDVNRNGNYCVLLALLKQIVYHCAESAGTQEGQYLYRRAGFVLVYFPGYMRFVKICGG